MDEKKLNESGAELTDEQLEDAAGGFFAPRKPGTDEKPGDVFADIKLPKKPGL